MSCLFLTEVYDKMVGEYEKLNPTDEIKERKIVEDQLAEIRSFISYDYSKEMDYIDKKINYPVNSEA